MKMKVTVCFGQTKVIVPCGSGHMLVRDLTEAAIVRFKKATGKTSESWVTVQSLKSISDGGFLDPDDQVAAVIDDKEQILAIYEEQDSTPPPIPHSCGEASSGGASSPDWTVNGDSDRIGVPSHSYSYSRLGNSAKAIVGKSEPLMGSTLPGGAVENSVEITSLDDPPSSGLMVRCGMQDRGIIVNQNRESPTDDVLSASSCFRGSIKIKCTGETEGPRISINSQKKKRPAPPPPKPEVQKIQLDNSQASTSFLPAPPDNNLDEGVTSPLGINKLGSFMRSGGPRQSSVGDKWLLAQERIENQLRSEENVATEDGRKVQSKNAPPADPASGDQKKLTIKFDGLAGKPLGIQVTPDYSESGRLSGVIVTQIHENGRINEDGKLYINDKIIEINGRPVYQMSFVRAQSYLHEIAQQSSLTLEIIRSVSLQGDLAEEKSSSDRVDSQQCFELAAKSTQSALQKANTRKIGQKLVVELRKGAQGLGFTVTSRDTAVEGERPFFIKTVLPRGAAKEDGRLQAADRLLEINGTEVTGLAQRQVVSLLRDFKQGDLVKLVISRHGDNFTPPETSPTPAVLSASPTLPPVPVSALQVGGSHSCPSPSLPRHLPPDRANVESLGSEREKQFMAFDIPLNATGSAGLGVSVKGRIATNEDGKEEDCGIYIKGIIHGGAVQKDGRLRINDQLIGIEDARLLGYNNEEAMNMISRTMQNLKPNASSIRLTVLRVVHSCADNKDVFPSAALNQPSGPPGSPDEGDSMYLDLERCHSPVKTVTERCRAFSDVQTAKDSMQSRYTIPGYGDYAVIVKGQRAIGGTPQMIEESTMIIQEEESSQDSHFSTGVPLYEEVGSTVADGNNDKELFSRDAPGRQSMSEKRHGGGKTDPSHTKTFQKIKEAKSSVSHQRQHSAPALQEIEILSPDAEFGISAENEAEQRRSLSLESLPRTQKTSFQQPMVHELVSSSILGHGQGKKCAKLQNRMKKVQRQRHTNDSFRQAVDRSYQSESVPAVEVGSFSGDDEELVGNSQSLPRPSRDGKERRKSTGSGLLINWFGRQFGSARSRESSLEKNFAAKEKEAQERAKRAAEDEQKKIREQYEKLKRQQQEIQKRQLVPDSPNAPCRWRPTASVQQPVTKPVKEPSKSTSDMPGGVPPPYQRLRRQQPPPPYHRIELPSSSQGKRVHKDSIPRDPAPRKEYEDPNTVPTWFSVVAEHRRFYRSLDRPTAQWVSRGTTEDRTTVSRECRYREGSTSQNRNGNNKTPAFSTLGGRPHFIAEQDLNNPRTNRMEEESRSFNSWMQTARPTSITSSSLRTSGAVKSAGPVRPNYESCLRQNRRRLNGPSDLHTTRRQRPSSDYYDYESGNHHLLQQPLQTVFRNPAYENEPSPDYSPLAPQPTDNNNGFIMRM